ncbi:lysophosphatidic acid receptor 1-B-like [Dendropsophus ebraccatus]|uniref:lysophosphatidic acid receptor 1-B-like n=1 Tax=Dendropsophus ebraccatus TaxID=150705 RepID=UPI0038314DE0
MNDFLNCSGEELNGSDVWSPDVVLALGISQMLTNIVSAIFNSAVIITITFSRDYTKCIFILFCNLAVSDLLVSLCGLWISVQFLTEPNSTLTGSWKTLIAYVSYTISILSTVYNLVSIGIERYLTVSGSTKFRYRVSRNQILSTVFIIWTVAIVLGSLPLLGWDCLRKDGNVSTLYGPFCIDYLAFITIPNCIVAFFFPLLSYVGIILLLRKQKLCMQAHGQHDGTYKAAEIQVAKTCIFIWILAVVSYAPFFGGVMWDVIYTVCPNKLNSRMFVFRNLSAMMITLNSLGDPIIYSLRLKTMSSSFVFCKCRSSNKISALTPGNG